MNNGTTYNQKYLHNEEFNNNYLLRSTTPVEKVFTIGNYESYHFRNHIILVYDLLGGLASHTLWNKERQIRGQTLKRIAWDLLEDLAIYKHLDLLHNDMKYDNILLAKTEYSENDYPFVKFIDFGQSCIPRVTKFDTQTGQVDETEYTHEQQEAMVRQNLSSSKSVGHQILIQKPTVCTGSMAHHYLSPEALLGYQCTVACDMWVFGSIIARLFLGPRVIDRDGSTGQLAETMQTIGLPPPDMLNDDYARQKFYAALQKIDHATGKNIKPYDKRLDTRLKNAGADQDLVDFIIKIMRWEPEKRMTPYEAMMHPWFEGFVEDRFEKLV